MKKTISTLFLLVMILSLFVYPSSSVKAQTPPPMESTMQIQNLDTVNPATIYIYYYDQDGNLVTLPNSVPNPVQDTVPAGSSNTYLTIHPGTGFKGSAVISSSAPIAIISNLTIAATNRALGTYVGASAGGSTVFFPLVDKRANISMFSVQNAGTGSATIVIDFIPQPGSGYADIADINDTLAEGASHSYFMGTYNGANQWLGSVKVTATTGSIVGVLANTNVTNTASPTNAVYNGMTAGAATIALPLVMEANSGNRTGTSCQNLGPNPATITMSYSPEAGYPARAADVFAAVPVNGIAAKLMLDTGATKWVGSSVVTVDSGSTIACVVNQSRPTLRRSSIYEGFIPTAATSKVVLPLIMSKNGSTTKAFTSFSVASADGTNISVTCDWKPAANYADIADTNKNGAPVLVFGQQTGFSANDTAWVGAAICTETGGKKIVAVVNQSREGLVAGTLRDVTSAYDGINQ